jgi:carbon-monoxide dehydrogenase medium subunit
MSRWQAYHTPATLDEALTLLADHPGQARIIAGGTDLILDLRAGHTPAPQVMVDVTRIEGMDQIRREGEWIVIGAGVTHTQMEQSDLLRRDGACLAESCGVVGGPQVRNVATIGGNVAHALPAADGTIGLLALGAEVEVATWVVEVSGGRVQRQWQPLLSLFAGPGKNNLGPNQLISAFRFRPTGPHEVSGFDRVMRPQGVALPVLGLGMRLALNPQRTHITQATLALGPAGPIPFRATDAEAVLTSGEPVDAGLIQQAIRAAQGQARLRTSQHRASQPYRHEMIQTLMSRVIRRLLGEQVLAA